MTKLSDLIYPHIIIMLIKCTHASMYVDCYTMDTRALAYYLLHEGAKRPRAINELSA